MDGGEGQEDTFARTVRREIQVVLSRNRSPLPSRIAKLVLFALVTRGLYRTRWFRAWIFGLPPAGLATHFLYWHMRQGWTRPWGGWRDVEAARQKEA
jgi:hypothetical protein